MKIAGNHVEISARRRLRKRFFAKDDLNIKWGVISSSELRFTFCSLLLLDYGPFIALPGLPRPRYLDIFRQRQLLALVWGLNIDGREWEGARRARYLPRRNSTYIILRTKTWSDLNIVTCILYLDLITCPPHYTNVNPFGYLNAEIVLVTAKPKLIQVCA